MIRYSPPKSNLWGHRTRRKKAADFRSCIVAFLAEAVREYTPSWSISAVPFPAPFSDSEQTFINELLAQITSIAAQETYSQPIREEEFEKCLDLLVSHENLFPPLAFLSLDCCYEISAWNFEQCGTLERRCCEITASYGTIQMVGTMLAFTTIEEYRWVKAVMKRVLGVELNDKHIRPRKIVS
jgi:hypothetical protein